MKKRIIKIFACFVIVLCIGLLTSCRIFKNEYTTMPNGVNITVPDELKKHFVYPDNVPSLHFGYDGINVLAASTPDHYTFVENDFYEISDEWGKFVTTFKDDHLITKVTKQTNETVSARLGGEFLPLDEFVDGKPQECSMEYLMICFAEDGSRYSCSFRTFVSGGKRYYGYSYTGNLEIKLNLPLQVVKMKDTGEKKLLLLPLPFDTKYSVSNNTRLEALLKKDTYLKESNYVFDYPEHYSNGKTKEELTLDQRIEEITNWYKKYCVCEEIDYDLYVEYAGARFRVNFDAGKEKEGFSLIWVGDATKVNVE